MPNAIHSMYISNKFVFFISVRFVPDKLPKTDGLIKCKGLAKDYLHIKRKAWESVPSLVPRIEAFALPITVERATQKPTLIWI